MSEPAPRAELVLYATKDGTVWLSQLEFRTLFQTTKQNISLHVYNLLIKRKLQAKTVVKEDLTTAADGKRYRMQATTRSETSRRFSSPHEAAQHLTRQVLHAA